MFINFYNLGAIKKNIYKWLILNKKRMKRGVSFGIFALLITVVSMLFVMAISYDVAPTTAEPGDAVSVLAFNVTNTSDMGNNFTQITVLLTGTASFGNITNVTLDVLTVGGGSNLFFNDSFTSSTVLLNFASTAIIDQETNFTINLTVDSSATWNETFGANVTAITNLSNITYSALPYASSLVRIADSTNPSASLSKTTSSTSSITVSFSCSDAFSDIDTCVLSSEEGTVSGSKISGLSCGKNYDITVTATDNEGNTAATTESLSTSSCGTSGGVIPPQLPRNSYSFSKVTPGVVSIAKDFDSEIGVKEIQINVNNEAQNVKITVTKHDGKPAEVSVAKSGDVYQYIEIDADNLNDGFGRAKVQFRVEKSWVNGNLDGSDDVGVFRFNENSNQWDELSTTFAGEDATYYFYDVELTGFSFFSVSEKTLISPDNGTGGTGILGDVEGGIPSWIWVIVAIVVIALLWVAVGGKKKRHH